jgi:hypothetical protein
MTGKIFTLTLLAFTALILPVSGCVVDNRNSPPTCANPIGLTWSIDDGVNTLSCGDVGAGWVRLTAAGDVTDFPCESYGGSTPYDAPNGRYSIDAQLLTPSRGTLLSEANNTFSVPTCGGIDIGHVAFLVN